MLLNNSWRVFEGIWGSRWRKSSVHPGNFLYKYGCGVVAFRLTLPRCETCFVPEELRMQIWEFDAALGIWVVLSATKELKWNFLQWDGSQATKLVLFGICCINYERRLLGNSPTLCQYLAFSFAGEKWEVENMLISAPWKRVQALFFPGWKYSLPMVVSCADAHSCHL